MKEVSHFHTQKKENGRILTGHSRVLSESIVFTDSHRYILVFDLRAKFLSRQEKNTRLAPWTRRRALGRAIMS
jgi:hypothetical protein